MTDNILLTQKIPKLFLSYVVPSVISMILVGIQGMVDGIFLGNFESTNAMASVNVAGPYMQLILGCSFIICTGTLSYLGRSLGEKDYQKEKNIFKTAAISVTAISILIMLVGVTFFDGIAKFLGANDVLLAGTSRYILILAMFAPVISFMLLCGFIGRLIEKPHLYLIATVCCLFSNITMNYAFICVLHLGVVGAALATGLSYFIGLTIVIWPLVSKKTVINVHEGIFHWKLLKETAYNGSSEGVNYLATSLILFLLNRAFMSLAGEDGVAAFTIINYIGNFTTILMFGISDGIGSIISCNYGAGKMARVRQTLYTAIVINFILGVILFAMLNLFSENLIRVFIRENLQVLDIAVQGAKIYAISFFFSGFNIVQSGYHTSLGNALASVIIAASRGIIFIGIGIFVLPRLWGLNRVWFTLPFAEIATVVCCFIFSKIKRLA